jgi:uncharacterized protein (DUF1800 family)
MLGPKNPWAPFEPTPADPWDLRKVAHLHRRAGFGATWEMLQRDLRAGPAISVDRLINPPPLSADEQQVLGSLQQGALQARDSDRLKALWLYRVLYDPDPLGEKLTLLWHSHFATSNRKVDSLSAMQQQNELLRGHARGQFADMLHAIVQDPAMLVWLDGGTSRREQPNENFAREFLELFTLGPGNFTEADIRQAARAFTGWVREPDNFRREEPRFQFDTARFDDGEKTFLGHRGAWNAHDIVRITLERPAAAEFLCRKLYRYFVREDIEPSAELIRPLAAELSGNQFSIRHVVAMILRSRHFYDQTVMRQRVKSPVEFSAGLLRMLDVPRANARLLALAATCDRQGQELFHPPNVRGWIGGRTWLNSTTLLERGNWSSDVVWGNPALGMSAFDPFAWATRNQIPSAQAAATLIELLVQGDLGNEDRQLILRTAGEGGADQLRGALQLIVHCPGFQLA